METIEVAESSPPKVVPAANNNNNDDEEDVGDVGVPSSEPAAEQPEPATPDVDEVDSILLLPPEIRCEKLEMTAVASPILGLLEDAPTELPEKEVVEEKPVVEDEDLPQLLENGRASSTESSSSSLSDVDLICEKNNCKMCQKKFTSPRVLACLHVFCEPCIMDILMIDDVGLGGDRKLCTVTCPLCKQLTRLGSAGIPALQPDYVATNIIDISTLDPLQLACTSCKSKEMAISRCNDCATFLCVSCDGAHRLMRCFENHTVVQLTEMRYAAGGGGGSEERVTIHKPLFCRTHVTENLKYFCFHCQVPVCNDCLLCEHKGPEHSYELISEAEKRMKKEVEGLMIEARTKFEFCEKQTSNLDSSLHELQSQHDAARDAIQETYAAFKSVLDQCHDETLSELKRLHADRELKIMDLFHNIGESAERIETACTFTEKVLEQANAPEFLSLKKMISSQFLNLITTIPKADVNYSLKFGGNNEKFEQILRECFGKLSTEVTPPSPKETTPPPTLPGMPPQLINKAQQANSTITGSSVTASSPISLPTSMQSSFDGDMSTLGNNSSHTSSFMQNVVGVLTPEPPQHQLPPPTYVGDQPPPQILAGAAAKQPNTSNFNQQPPLQCLTSIAEYNLHRLANLAGNSPVDALAPAVPPPVVSHPANSQFTLNDLLSGDPNALNNFEAIAKNSFSEFGRRGGAPPAIMPDFPNPFVPPPPAALLQQPSGSIFNVINGGDGDFAGSQGIPGRSKATPMQIRCKFGSLGPSKGQFNAPHGFCLGLEEEIIVADTNNHRIQVFEKNGTFKSQFGIPGKDEGQLWYPRKVAVMRTNNRFVVCDRGNERSRMQIFTKMGHFIKKIAIRYIDIVAGLAVTNSGHIVAVDSVSPTVFIISEEGELVHWFDCSDYMREPSDIAINGSDFYVCDFKGHCVAVFSEHGNFIARIGTEKVTCFPNGIDISDAGDILIGDSHGNRFHVACYSRDGTLQSEFECPHVKVSRCCGLKITSEGYVVTLAKNNHHVLVLNTLYIQ